MGLFQGQPGGRVWRRYLSENAIGADKSPDVLLAALEAMVQTRDKAQQFLDDKPQI